MNARQVKNVPGRETKESETPLNNSVDMKGDCTIRKGLCGDQPALMPRELGNSLAALANRLGISPAGVGYAAQRGEAIGHENGYRLIQ